MISFTIVIPLYNKQKSVINTLLSVLNQTYQSFEVLVIDDGSTDESVNRVRSLNSNIIQIIQKPNGGVCSARNAGIQIAKNDYIAFLDADDIWSPDYLEKQVKSITDFNDAAMWGQNFAPIRDSKRELLLTGLPEGYRGYITDYFKMKRVSDLFCSSSVVVKKDVFDKVGFFDERIKYSEDLDMWYRIILNFPVVFSDEILVNYNHDSENRALRKRIRLKDFLPYYVSKYNTYCEVDYDFSHFIHTFCAAHIRTYYFGESEEYNEAKVAVKHLRYQDIHFKYRLWYKTPYPIGWLVYKLTMLKHKLKEK